MEVVMPQLGESVTEGQIVRWLKAPGEKVGRFEPLVEVLTDKVTVEVPSPAEGTLLEVKAAEGSTVAVGTVIAVLDAEQGAGVSPDGSGRGEYSPAVRRLAKEYGIDLAQVKGTGEAGRVTREDVLRVARERQAQGEAGRRAPATVPDAPAVVAAAPSDVEKPAAGRPVLPDTVAPAPAPAARSGAAAAIREVIARRMTESWTSIPHAWTVVEADVTSLVALRDQVRQVFMEREGFELTFLPFAIKAVVEALQEWPDLNASWQDGKVVRHRQIHVGVAVGLEEALLVPVLREADRLSLTGIARALHDLVRRAREGRLSADETSGGTFTVNNTGALGSILSAPIINPPQAAILTTEAVTKRLVVLKDDQIAIRSVMNLCLSFDHRVADGVHALRFLNAVKRRLEALGPGTPLA
ncbi:dihydrolipoamide acetyltransferase family protein [Carboxydochorda subterranea]|uniref:Dihydrolipoamide acetyltransferase component of pyruvate dehydrogenase complex n=1 Tax=Carboxydichorda subterranea TaxID=3109565 RepID=A0ABZ1C234_9FIRM|nr:dihydrolipoamide acetyltransferase family protein [Limnochorda sp. L945t]WRP18979.1 dihydrolipoamide acetyltransferase family protein [Limnochorda sp. L945t]